MKKRIFSIILTIIAILSFYLPCLADKISAPPPLRDEPPAEQHYLKEIYDNLHELEVVTSNPDGSRKERKGAMLLLQTGGNSYLEINSDGSTTWLGVQLTNTP